jgi:hypothetical protein
MGIGIMRNYEGFYIVALYLLEVASWSREVHLLLLFGERFVHSDVKADLG